VVFENTKMKKSNENCGPDDAECEILLKSVADSLYVIGGKWKLQIIIALFKSNRRFNDLQRTVSGISARVLSNQLKDLEENGFVKRKIDADAFPVLVEYELTPYSFTLENVVNSLSQWGITHREFLKAEV
jgi:DNA-binding HxlR family transcriptional regulator